MGIFDFFKKIIEKKDEEPKQEQVPFSELGKWLEDKTKETENKEKKVLILINEKIHTFTKEFKEKINIVNSVDVESKKAEDRIKSIVIEGRKQYLEAVESFIEKLENLEKQKLEKVIPNINKIFLDFNKSSHMNYERATILIGKEMAEIKNNLKDFSKDLIKLFDENKDIPNFLKTISLVKLKLNKITEAGDTLGKISKTIISLDKKITDKEQETKKTLEEIEEIKKSRNHIENLERQKNIKLFNEELDENIILLKQLIDFKLLTNFFHIFEKEMKIVKAHRDNFQVEFKEDNGKSILNLLSKANLNTETIAEQIKQINNKKEQITKLKQEIKKDKTEELYSETTKIILEIGNLKHEKAREQKRIETLKESKKEITREIKNDLKVMNVIVVD